MARTFYVGQEIEAHVNGNAELVVLIDAHDGTGKPDGVALYVERESGDCLWINATNVIRCDA